MENKIVIYKEKSSEIQVDVNLHNESVWLTQAQMPELFEKDRDTVGVHIKNIYNEGELVEEATAEESSVVQKEGVREVSRNILSYNQVFNILR